MGEYQSNKIEKIAILTDTGSYISFEEAKEKGIYLLPLQIVEGEHAYLDLIEIQTKEVYQKNYDEVLLKTSLPPLAMIYSVFEEIKKDGYESVILVPLTPGISSTASTIQSIAKELSISLSIIDTFTTCTIQKYVVEEVKKCIDLQYSKDEIIKTVNKMIQNSNSYILANDIKHLKRGGRLTPAAAVFANMLKIKPILTMNESTMGKIDVLEKVRTVKKAKKRLVELTLQDLKHENYQLFVLHSDAYDEAIELKQELISNGIKEEKIIIEEFSSVIAVHVGMKCLAIQHIEENKGEK